MQVPGLGKMRRPGLWLGAGFFLLVAMGGGVWALRQGRGAGWDLEALTIPVETSALQVQVSASGTVQPLQSVNLSPKNAGLLAELLVDQGDEVSAGQVVARMEAADLTAEIAQAQARLAQAQARLDRLRGGSRPQEIAQAAATVRGAEARLEEGRSRLQLTADRAARNRQLVTEGALSQDDLDTSLNELANAQTNVAQLEAALSEAQETRQLVEQGNRAEDIAEGQAQVAEARAAVEAVQVRQADTLIRAPFSGTVTQKFATAGAFVTPTTSASDATSATSTAIVAIANGLEILAEVPEVDISAIAVGQTVQVRADAFPDTSFEGEVRLVAPEAVVRQNVTSFQVRVALRTGEDQLRSGMNVDVIFLGEELNEALVVPTVAIVTQQGEVGVLVPGTGTRQLRFRPVTIGPAVGNQTQILAGVRAGERIFIDLPPGQSLENLNFGLRDEDRGGTNE